jgi:selenocysteine-specific translation elongation factor
MMIGTAGHIDHGKTSLVRALTGTDTDRLPEEKKRGMSIELGFAFLEDGKAGPERDARISGKVRIGFIDVPGHEKLLHTMIAGATGIDFALLVVAADDGVMPQTREHLAVLSLLGVRRGIVALTKTDRVDAARVAEVTADIKALLAPTPLADARIVPVSTVTGAGIDELRHWLVAEARCMAYGGTPMPWIPPLPPGMRFTDRRFVVTPSADVQSVEKENAETEAAEADPVEVDPVEVENAAAPNPAAGESAYGFRLAIDRAFTLDGVGTVVTGTVHGGQVQVGDVLMQMPVGPDGLRVRSLHAQNRSTGTAHTGQRCAINLAGVERDVLQRGHWVAQPGIVSVSDRLDVELTLWHEEPRALRSGTRVHVHLGTTASPAATAVLDGDVSVPALDEGAPSAVGGHEGAGKGLAVPEDADAGQGAGAGRDAGAGRGGHAAAGREVSEAVGMPVDTLAPGRTGLVQLVLPQPLAAWHGDRLIVRDAAGQRIIGGGRVLTSLAPVRYRRTPQRLALLRVLQRQALADRLAGLLAVSDEGVDLAQWQRVFGLSSVAVFDALLAGHDMSATGGAAQPEAASAVSAAVHPAETVSPTGAACPAKVASLAEAVLPTGAAAPVTQTVLLRHRRLSGTFVIGEAAWQRLSASVLQTLAHYHETATEEIGPDAARLRRLARLRLDDAHWRLVLDALAKQGLIALSGAFVHLPEHGTELAARDQTLLERLMPRLMEADVQGAWVRDLAEAVGEQPTALRPAMARLARGGYVYPVVKDLYITAATAAKLAAIVRRLAQENVPSPAGSAASSSTPGRPDHTLPVLTVAAFRDASGLGRKRAVQVLEFFDRIGLCRRVGDTHILRTESLLFRE